MLGCCTFCSDLALSAVLPFRLSFSFIICSHVPSFNPRILPFVLASVLLCVRSSCTPFCVPCLFLPNMKCMFCSIPSRSGLSCSRPFYCVSSRSNFVYGFYSLSLSLALAPISLSLALSLSLSLSLSVSFSPPLSWCLSLLRWSPVFSRPAVMSFGLQTLLPTALPPSLPSSFPPFNLAPPRSSLPSFLPSFLSFVSLVSFMSSRIGGQGERTHRRTREHTEKRERQSARKKLQTMNNRTEHARAEWNNINQNRT